jgi:hypothetical protein
MSQLLRTIHVEDRVGKVRRKSAHGRWLECGWRDPILRSGPAGRNQGFGVCPTGRWHRDDVGLPNRLTHSPRHSASIETAYAEPVKPEDR